MSHLACHKFFQTAPPQFPDWALHCEKDVTTHTVTWTSPYTVATEIRKITLFTGADYNNLIDLMAWATRADGSPLFFWAWDHFANPTKSASWEIDFGSPGMPLAPNEPLTIGFVGQDYGMLPDKIGVYGLTRATFLSHIYVVVP